MSDVVIRVNSLGKKYRIRHQRKEAYTALRDVIADKARGLFHLDRREAEEQPAVEDFWALKDVSFEIKRGEVIGIIGRNGAGKSTLLKILSRITEPTEGRIELNGRVASLLEVGTGFHPELTGRENIYLNGAMLGMTRLEIRRKFDEIVAFAEVEKFLDTPVKRYSSGMYVRLAFAVAAHLEPEILVIDEVLAVGDAQFQRKCLGRMGEFAGKEGRTVLLVSHNMTVVSGLCHSAIWLDSGRVTAAGEVDSLVQAYLATSSSLTPAARLTRRNVGEDVQIYAVELLVDGVPSAHVQAGQPCSIRVHYRVLRERIAGPLSLSVMLFAEGQKLVNLWTNCLPDFLRESEELPPIGFADCQISKWPFRSKSIRVDVFSHIGPSTQDWIEEALVFESHDGDYYGSGVITDRDQGILFLDHSWRFHAAE